MPLEESKPSWADAHQQIMKSDAPDTVHGEPFGYAQDRLVEHPFVVSQSNHPWASLGRMKQPMRGFGVYILECADKSYYTGHTDNLEKRLYEHEQNLFKCYTSKRLPVRLVYSCEFETREGALARERQIKGWSRRKKQALIAGDWSSLVDYSKGRANRPSTGPSASSGQTKQQIMKSDALDTVHGELVEP